MTEPRTAAQSAGLGWPEDAQQGADASDGRLVSRETSAGLGWPEGTA